MRTCAVCLVLLACSVPLYASPDSTVRGGVLAEWGFGEGELRWDGALGLSAGEITDLASYSFDESPAIDKLSASAKTWTSLTIRRSDGLTFDVNGPADALLTFDTKQGRFAITLRELADRRETSFPVAGGNRLDLTFRETLTPSCLSIASVRTEDDWPTVATGADGGVVSWLRFGDRSDAILCAEFDDAGLGDAVVLSADLRDNHRPQAAMLENGDAWVVWSANRGGNWDLYARRVREGRPGRLVRVTRSPGPDLHCAAAADGNALRVAWQGWRGGSFDILCCTIVGERVSPEEVVSASPESEWQPTLAVRSDGEVTCAWDTYRNGSYDVYARTRTDGSWGPETPIAATEEFEAHASAAYAEDGSAWIVWESGGADWGKDSRNTGLRAKRSLRMRRLRDGRTSELAAPLETALGPALSEQSEMGQLVLDDEGALWLFFRGMPVFGLWAVYVTRYGAEGWTPPARLWRSNGRQDQRVGAAAGDGGLWVAWETDNRTRRAPGNSDVFLAHLDGPGAIASPSPGAAVDVVPAVVPRDPTHPRLTAFPDGDRLLLYGDLHRHTDLSVCRAGSDGSLEDAYRYALDAARLDFVAVTDHIQHAKTPSAYERWRTEKAADMYYIPGRLTPLFGYERSQRYPDGHRNIITSRRGLRPVPRTRENIPWSANSGYPGESKIPTAELWMRLAANYPTQISIPHTPGDDLMGGDWSCGQPLIEPVVEIYQGHRISYESPGAPAPQVSAGDSSEEGSVRAALARGYRLGFIASSDHMSTHMSYACVYAKEHTREAIIAALRERLCYAATDTIALRFSVGDAPMGGECSALASAPPTITAELLGVKEIARVDLIKDGDVVETIEPEARRVRFSYVDRDAAPGTSTYYVRAVQDGGMFVWGSPVWVTYR